VLKERFGKLIDFKAPILILINFKGRAARAACTSKLDSWEDSKHLLEGGGKPRTFRTYTGCPRRNVPDFGRVFLMLKYTDITQNTYVQS